MRHVLFLIVLPWLIAANVSAGEPQRFYFEGKHLDEWLEDFKDQNILIRVRAAGIVGKHHPAKAREAVAVLVQFSNDANPTISKAAIVALGDIGPPAAHVVAELARTFKQSTDDNLRVTIVETLGKIGSPESSSLFQSALTDGSLRVRGGAAVALGQLGPAAKEAVPALLEALQDPAREVRVQAASALGKIGPVHPRVVPALLAELEQENVREAAAQALVAIGPATHPQLLPALNRLLKSPFRDAREVALRTIGKLGPTAKGFVPLLLESLADADAGSAGLIYECLGGMGEASPSVLAALEKGTNSTGWETAEAAWLALSRLGKNAAPVLVLKLRSEVFGPRATRALATIGRPAIPDLLKTLESATPNERARIVSTLAEICTNSENFEPLTDALKSAHASVRSGSAAALGQVGTNARPALPALIDCLADVREDVRAAAALAIHRIDPACDRDALAVWLALLRGPDREDRLLALGVLAPFSSDVAEVTSAFAELADDDDMAIADRAVQMNRADHSQLFERANAAEAKDAKVRRGCIRILQKRGAQDQQAIAVLAAALEDDDARIRILAAETLHQINPELSRTHAARTAPVWAVLARVKGEKQTRAIAVLGHIGPPAQQAAATLLELLDDPDLSLRLEASQALVQVDPAQAERAVSVWIDVLRSTDTQLQQRATTAFESLGPDVAASAAALGRALYDQQPYHVRLAAVHALGRMGAAANPALPDLLAVLKRRDPRILDPVMIVLMQIGPPARDAVPDLVDLTRNATYSGRATAALQVIDPSGSVRRELLLARWSLPVVFAVLGLSGMCGLMIAGQIRRQRRARRWEFIESFTSTLRPDDREAVFTFLAAHPDAAPAQQRDLLLADQAYRWFCDDPRPVEDYLQRCSAVAADEKLVLDLLVGECACALQAGQSFDAVALAQRFPNLAARLHKRLKTLDRQRTASEEHSAEKPAGTVGGETSELTSGTMAEKQIVATVTEAPAVEFAPTRSFMAASAFLPMNGVSEEILRPQIERIGRYRIEGILGEGAFGTVYLGRDEELRRTVAIKVPKRSRIATEKDVEAYMAEARVLASLDHPGIVTVYDVGRTADGLCYVVSKHIDGTDLARRQATQPLSPVDAAGVVMRVAEALDHAHQKRLVHRDIKPANLLLDVQGNVFVADFGLALTLEDFERRAQLAGTPLYMSPEQSRSEALDGRSDLFSLGVVFYELLTGRRPFEGHDLHEVVEQIQSHKPTSPHVLNGRLPQDLSAACMRCLAKNPDERFANGHDLAAVLRRWLKSDVAAELDPRFQHVVGDRLRPFEAKDAALYLEVLTGVSDRYELPDILRFWKNWVETDTATADTRVGVLTGPRGSGKTSLLRAGLLPRLDPRVAVVFITVPRNGNVDMLAELRQRFPDVPALPADEAMRWLAAQLAPGHKILLVFDSFQHWLLSHQSTADLAPLLTMCDGLHIQTLLVAAAEALAPVGAWLDQLGIAVVEGRNLHKQSLLDVGHTRRVLTYLGQALRCLPDDLAALSLDQRLFLDRAAADLAPAGQAAPVRIAGLVHAFRQARWLAGVYSQMGGIDGSIAALLDDRFRGPLNLAARQAAQRLLASIATEGRVARPAPQSPQEDAALEEALTVLDDELKLVTIASAKANVDHAGPRQYRFTDGHAASGCQLWLKQKAAAKSTERFKRRGLQTAWEDPVRSAQRAAAVKVWEQFSQERRKSPHKVLLGLVASGSVLLLAVPAVLIFYNMIQSTWDASAANTSLGGWEFYLGLAGIVIILVVIGISILRKLQDHPDDGSFWNQVKQSPSTKRECPSCHLALAPNSVICLHCGHNVSVRLDRLPRRLRQPDDEDAMDAPTNWAAFRWHLGLALMLLGGTGLAGSVAATVAYQVDILWSVIAASIVTLLAGALLRQ